MQTLRDIFYKLDNHADKWNPYFDVYETWFSKFRGKKPRILEIGVYKGGSAEMWSKYFGEGTYICGIDIDPSCKQYERDGFQVVIGDAGDLNFWRQNQLPFAIPVDDSIGYDIIIDDGGHHMDQQIFTLQNTWKALKYGGIYLCEDTHTSYWEHWPNSGYLKPSSFMEYSKNFIDGLNSSHTTKGPDGETFPGPSIKKPMGNTVLGIHYYDSMVVIEKVTPKPFNRVFSRPLEPEEKLQSVSDGDILTINTNRG